MKNPLAQRMITGLLTLILALGSGPGVTSVAWARTLTEASGAASLTQEASLPQETEEPEDLAAEKPESSNQEETPEVEETSLSAESEAPAQLTVSDEAPAPASQEPLRRDGAWVAAGDFQVSGGTAGVDFQFTAPTLHILTSTPLTVKNTNSAVATAHNIEVNAGVKADLTLAGVNISCDATSPINMVTNSMDTATGQKAVQASEILHPTKLHLTLADGSINTLINTHNGDYNGRAGLRVGWGSILVIDDSIRNLDTSNAIVTPFNGMVAQDVTLIGGQSLKAGDPLTKMDAVNPGSLTVTGGAHSAGIGGGNKENAGTIIINGGRITSQVQYFNGSGSWGLPNGSGIGGGACGSGTIITINGGRVEATGGSCGTGIGAGFGYVSTSTGAAGHVSGSALPDAIAIPEDGTNAKAFTYSYMGNGPFTRDSTVSAQDGNAPFNMQYPNNANFMTVAGDISINGGYVIANAAYHGNAIGQCCAHGGASNEGHVIRVTGGTVISRVRNKTSSDPYMYGIGARKGYTIVTGGSVLVEDRPGTTSPMFQGLGDTAYNTQNVANWDDVIREAGGDPLTSSARLSDNDKVQMVAIDLSGEFGSGENKTVPITKWKLEINNFEQNYGSPSYLDDGKLYLWLPLSAKGQKVTVTLSYRDNAGVEKNIEPLYVEEVGGGSLLKRYIDIDIDKLTPEEQASFGRLTKPYDGEPFETLDVSKTPINTTGFEESGKVLNDASAVSVSYQQYNERGGSPLPGSSVITTGSMPADTGIFKFELISKQYAKEGTDFGKSYWGHRIAGWSEITPVPAVLTVNSVQWGYLDEATGDWQEITQNESDEGKAGNRLKLDFTIRSANTEALTCASPTGSFQVSIDGKNVGDPIPLTQDAFKASAYSTLTHDDMAATGPDGSTQTRHGTQAVYYLDPSNRDGLLQLLKGAASGGEHKVNIEYLADKNYIQGADKNPENQDDGTAVIVPVTPESEVTGDGVTITDTPTDSADPIKPSDPHDPDYPVDPNWPFNPYDPTDPTNPLKPSNPSDPSDPQDDFPVVLVPEQKTKIVRKTINASYGAFHDPQDPEKPSTFDLKLESSSSAPISYYNVNPAVVDFARSEDGEPQLDEKGNLKISVNSCGTTVLVMDQGANAFYNGTRYIITVNIAPDPTLRPKIQVRLTWRNLTAMGEAGQETPVAARFSALKFAPAPTFVTGEPSLAETLKARAPETATQANRADTPPRPGDTIEYTVSGLNITPGSAWKAGELIDTMREHLKFNDNSVELAANYPTHSDKTYLGTAAFYQGFDWDSLDWKDVAPKSDAQQDGYVFANDAVTKGIGVVYGGQSTSVRFTAQVQPGSANRPGEEEGLKTLKPQHDASGSFGKSGDEFQPGDDLATPLTPLTNAGIQVIDDNGYAQVPSDPSDPTSPLKWEPLPGNPDPDGAPAGDPAPSGETPIISADPKDGSLVTTVKVENTEKIEQHEDDRTLVGDKLKVTATASNTEADTKLADAVIKVVVPEGIEPIPGTLRLTDATGKVYEVPDGAYNPKTGTIAVTAGDIYGGEAAQLTFDAEVLSTKETRRDQDPQYPDRPQDLPIDASTYGDTPTEEWRNQHRDDDDDPGSENPGDNPGGEDPDSPGGGGDNPGGGDDNPGGGDDPSNPGDNPGGDKKPYEKPTPGQPYDPEDHGTTWDEMDEDKKQSGPTSDPDAMPVLPASPQVDKDESKSDIKISKEAQNLSRDDGATYIGDTVAYTVVLSNSKPHTAWYNAVIRDPLPEGLEPVAGTIKLVDPAGAAHDVPDSAYNPETRLLAVSAGTLLGGTQATLTFQCTITEDALGADIGNVAEASGESPAGVTIDANTGAPQTIEPGQRFDPPGGWDEYLEKNGSISNASLPAYAPGTSASQGPLTTQTAEKPAPAKTQVVPKGSHIVPTGDQDAYLPLTLGVMALLGVAAATVLLVKERR